MVEKINSVSSSDNMQEEDRISRLPDELIHHILSFIDTKYAVQTCVLSKRWIDIWKSLPFLNFNRDSFSKGKEHDEKFAYFVDMVFIHRDDSDIMRFAVCWYNFEFDDDDIVELYVNRWIDHVVKHNVQEVITEIWNDYHSPYEIPYQLLNCRSLKKLEIFVSGDYFADVISPKSVSLPQLKVLYLFGLSISNVEFF